MDDIEALFGRARAPSGGGGVRKEPVHVLGDADELDSLGGELPLDGMYEVDETHSLSSAADGWLAQEPSRVSRTASLASSIRKPMRGYDPLTLDDADELAEELDMRPLGSSKVIEADEEGELEAWPRGEGPSSRPARAGGAPGAPRARAARTAPARASSGLLAAASSVASLLAQDALRQYRTTRRFALQRLRQLRGTHVVECTRVVQLNDAAANAAVLDFCDNMVTTNKYNVVTFVPRFLFEEFSKYANVFFLFIGCIQQIPNVSPTNRWTTLVPLGIVLLASALKEMSEDWRRAMSDAELNARTVEVLEPELNTWAPRRWRDVRVGDVVRVERDDFFPADLVLLASSEPEGLAYVETANLDGETNLKVRQAPPATAGLTSAASVATLRGRLECEPPNNSLHTFDGTLHLEGRAGRGAVPVGPDQLLLRGAQLRNAPWAYGLAVFTGHDTKLMRNTTATPTKRTRVDGQVNALIIALFVLLLALSVISAIGALIQATAFSQSAQYLMPQLDDRSGARAFVESILTFIILYNSLIPISLIVTMEFVKFNQALLINSDLEMYDEASDTPAQCRRSNLVEELGQVDHIFSDKTGTLTRNVMQFREAAIGGVSFRDAARDDAAPDERDAHGRLVSGERTWAQLPTVLGGGDALGAACDEFLTLLAVCHTVIPETREGRVTFQASSPDEAALVAGAQALGYSFTARKPRSVYIEVHGAPHEYEVLQVCEFTSARKRMSTVVRRPDGRITLFCKGADTVLLPRLGAQQACLEATVAALETYAGDGLRTLCIAKRELAEDEYRVWAQRYEAAATSVHGRVEALERAAEEVERDLELLGATAIEDRLQEGVPETIATLQTAGIKVWVLTGDRQETAINIGYSCRLISESMSVLVVSEAAPADTRDALQRSLDTALAQRADERAPAEEFALVVEGHSLQHVLHDDALADVFLPLAAQCRAVVCCRVSPLQKALVVELVKRRSNDILLAIGDGANDVGMIQAAHVGIGISGLEGLQAARSADVSIAQFRFLRKLLLVHGNWSYARLSKSVLYSFYKTVTLYVTLFWFSLYNKFSGQTAYESWSQSFYNVVFTMMPTLVIGIFDQYVSAAMLERYPQLYRQAFFRSQDIASWMANAVYHSLLTFFLVTGVLYGGAVVAEGYATDMWIWGTTLYFVVLVTVLGKAALVSNLWTRYTLAAIPGSFAVTLVFFVFYGGIAPALGVSMELYVCHVADRSSPQLPHCAAPADHAAVLAPAPAGAGGEPAARLCVALLAAHLPSAQLPHHPGDAAVPAAGLVPTCGRVPKVRAPGAYVANLQEHSQGARCAARAPLSWVCVLADRGRAGAYYPAVRHDEGAADGAVREAGFAGHGRQARAPSRPPSRPPLLAVPRPVQRK